MYIEVACLRLVTSHELLYFFFPMAQQSALGHVLPIIEV